MMKRAMMMAAVAAATMSAGRAEAFCGFYVAGSGTSLVNDATQVVLMRKGTRTVLAMQNSYKGPPEAFAMVVPVPVVLHEGDVKTLAPEVFAHVEQMGAPRLVEYWEQDPCRPEPIYDQMPMASGGGVGNAAMDRMEQKKDLGVKIEAKFAVGEYQVLILSAKDSTGLSTWLRQEKYTIPEGAEPLLRPYVEAGMKFFVAKVDPAKVKFVDGRAALSPLRFHYDSEEFALPIRLGLANSGGKQDLIVNILAPGQRYEVANAKNVTIPTNLDVKDAVKGKFAAFYAALFDRTLEKNPGAVVTEYAWQATTCDPCPGPALDYGDFATLGADVLEGAREQPAGYGNNDFVLTRLHARYGKDLKDDLVFKAAAPIVGGREFVQAAGKLEEGARPDSTNNFQGRYAIRHEWTGPIKCDAPKRGVWGGPPQEVAAAPGYTPTGIQPATGLAFVARDSVTLAEVVRRDVPEIDLKVAAGATVATPGVAPAAGSAAGSAVGSGAGSAAVTAPVVDGAKKKSGCGCQTSSGGDVGGGLVVVGIAVVAGRRRRRR
jgi:MYXO-CTERM domain-containing protein